MLSQVFRRDYKGGWLILSGPTPKLEERGLERLLELIDRNSAIVVVSPSGEVPVHVNDWLEDMSAVLEMDITTVDTDQLSDPGNQAVVRSAGLLIVAADEQEELSEDSQRAFEILTQVAAEEPGLVMWLVEAQVFGVGEWRYHAARDECISGLAWLPGCLLLGEMDDLNRIEPIQTLLRSQLRSYSLSLLDSATIAFGPSGEVDLWGSPTPRIILGAGWAEG